MTRDGTGVVPGARVFAGVHSRVDITRECVSVGKQTGRCVPGKGRDTGIGCKSENIVSEPVNQQLHGAPFDVLNTEVMWQEAEWQEPAGILGDFCMWQQ